VRLGAFNCLPNFQPASVPTGSTEPRAEALPSGMGVFARLATNSSGSGDMIALLRTELAFYIGCMSLQKQLLELREPTCSPAPAPAGERKLSFSGLYDICLALSAGRKIVGNDLNADGKDLIVITGANTGGKSTFLRSLGLAQLMMQAGMFVPADTFSAEVCSGVFTHYKREEDVTMESGKLGRISDIVDRLTPTGMMLFNESFAATNVREGSDIACQVTKALVERGIKLAFVTHLYEFAHDLCETRTKNAIFLRAERHIDGTRTFRMVEGEPLQTSYGKDLHDNILASRHPSEP
jgi:DNA mismatch repair ATPase MutS